MNDSITRQVLSLLKFAPLFLIFNSFWMLDNKQTFDNKWMYKMESVDHMPSGHIIGFKIGQSSPLLMISIVSICILIL